RRFIVSICSAGAVFPALGHSAWAQSDANGLVPDSDADQTDALQAAIDLAARSSGRLALAPGRYRTGTLNIPGGLIFSGVPGASLVHNGDGPLLLIEGADGAVISGVSLDGAGAGGELWHGGLIHVAGSD